MFFVDTPDEDPNGSLRILKVGDCVTIREPLGGHDHGIITKICRKNREGITPVHVYMRYSKKTRKVASWYIQDGWH